MIVYEMIMDHFGSSEGLGFTYYRGRYEGDFMPSSSHQNNA